MSEDVCGLADSILAPSVLADLITEGSDIVLCPRMLRLCTMMCGIEVMRRGEVIGRER